MTLAQTDSSLFGALTLEERATLPALPALPADPEMARQRLQRWQQQTPFDADGFFGRRLAQAELDEGRLLALLGESPEALARRASRLPGWRQELEDALGAADPDYQLPIPAESLANAEASFLWLAAPLIESAEHRITRAAQALAAGESAAAFDPATVTGMLLAGLPAQLLWTLSRVCVLELNIARLEDRITGDTPAERFAAFIRQLRRPSVVRQILDEYPVLARQLVLRLRNWADAAIELLTRLSADWQLLHSELGRPATPGPLVDVRFGAGDRHRGNRTVTLLQFASGWRLVYKPRPQAIAVHFQEILGWLGQRGFEPKFRLLGVLDRGDYGWMEFAHGAPCRARREVSRFYHRMGGYLALLYALDAGDFHHENLIAAGEHPMLIDLESIIEPRPPLAIKPGAGAVAEEQLARSVLRVGLLPQKAVGGGEGVDISALGMAPGQISEGGIPHWQGQGTDQMYLDRSPMEMIASEHRASLDGTLTDVSDYVDDLAEGFARAYRLIARHKDELETFLTRMAQDEARVILRSTRTYGHLLQESFHPFLLREALERDRHFDNLWQGVLESPSLEEVIEAEREDLLASDIPLFSARLDSRDLLGPGGRIWPDFLERSGLDMVRQRLATMDDTDLDRQLWFVRAAVATHQINVFGLEGAEDAAVLETATSEVGTESLLEAAVAVGERLEELALRSDHGREATWIGVQSRQGRNFRLTPLGHDLYAGLPGVVLFLARLAEVTGEDRFRHLARAGLRTIRGQSDAARELVTSVGGYEGWGGTIWAMTHLAKIWHDDDLLNEARDMVALVTEHLAEDRTFDLLAGSAGCIAALLACHRSEPWPDGLAAAVACGEHLLNHVQPMEHGASWMPDDMRRFAAGPLTGLGHGAAGYAWALLELADASGDERFHRAALGALAYERSLFEPELGTWKEMRTLEATNVALERGEDTFLIAWCHGAPGVGLARLRGLRLLDDAETRREIDIALDSTLSKGFGRSHCLCHGDLGNAELFVEAAAVLGEIRWLGEARRATAHVLAAAAAGGWRSGLPRGVEVPGLMTGLAGMGYGLLRLAVPERVPSVLLLDSP